MINEDKNGEKVNIDNENWKKLNLKDKTQTLIIFVICILIALFLGGINGYLATIKLTLIGNSLFFIFSFLTFIYCLINRYKVTTVLLMLAASIMFFIGIFHSFIK